MPAYTFFYDGEILPNQPLQLGEDESHHLARVMRLNTGDRVELINGRGVQFQCEVQSASKASWLLPLACTARQVEKTYSLEIVQGLPSLNKADLIVEKLTELGVDRISFFAADRSGREQLNEHQLRKLQAKCISACKQSSRLTLPELNWYKRLEEIDLVSDRRQLLTLDPRASYFHQVALQGEHLVAVIGPESGLSEKETARLDQMGAQRISIHEHVLRTETASLATAVLLHNRLRFPL